MDFSTAYQNPTRFLNLTSLHPEEFDILLPLFREEWYKFYRFRTLEGKRRKSAFSKYRKQTRTLPTVEDKLFFLLTYLKNNPLQHFQGAAFGLSQAKTSIWFNALLPLLRTVLGRLKCLPCRDGHALKQALEEFDVQVLTQDVVEQHTGRKTAADAQEVEYSGKKKAHTNKNKVDCLDNQYVVFLSNSYPGHVHDKQIADEECCNYPRGIILRQDKGFEGYRPQGVTIVEPFKKPKGVELTYCQKWYNYVVSQERIVVEHAIGGIRRCRIVKERNRLSFNKRDAAMETCTGLHNFRVMSPFRSYSEEPLETRTWTRVGALAHVYDFFPN